MSDIVFVFIPKIATFSRFSGLSLVHWIVLLFNVVVLARFINEELSIEFLELIIDIFPAVFFQRSIEIQLLCLILKF